mmetsp:Transcript_4331/g.11548  ORF Transcript_4331/g.11548 Transcript_4331/m.11548 type:complete len:388 (+) Transcript_4331:506-1669(+)
MQLSSRTERRCVSHAGGGRQDGDAAAADGERAARVAVARVVRRGRRRPAARSDLPPAFVEFCGGRPGDGARRAEGGPHGQARRRFRREGAHRPLARGLRAGAAPQTDARAARRPPTRRLGRAEAPDALVRRCRRRDAARRQCRPRPARGVGGFGALVEARLGGVAAAAGVRERRVGHAAAERARPTAGCRLQHAHGQGRVIWLQRRDGRAARALPSAAGFAAPDDARFTDAMAARVGGRRGRSREGEPGRVCLGLEAARLEAGPRHWAAQRRRFHEVSAAHRGGQRRAARRAPIIGAAGRPTPLPARGECQPGAAALAGQTAALCAQSRQQRPAIAPAAARRRLGAVRRPHGRTGTRRARAHAVRDAGRARLAPNVAQAPRRRLQLL